MKTLDILLKITIYSGVLFCAIMALKICFKNRMSTSLHFLIWGLLIARLLIPITLESSVHLITIPAQQINEPVQEPVQLPNMNTDTTLSADASIASQPQPQTKAATASTTVMGKPAALKKTLSLSIEEILLAVWLTGVGIGLLYLAVLYSGLRKRIQRNAEPPSKHLLKLFDEVKDELKIKRDVRIIGQCEYGTPAVLFPNTVLMPINTLVSMNDKQVKFVLRHELMHLKRNDHIFGLLLSLLNAIYWFNPIVWIAFKKIRTDMETACDGDIVRSFSRSEKNIYAAVILSLFSKKQYGNLVLGMVHGKTRQVAEKRIRGVFMNHKTNRGVKIASILIAALLLFTCFTTACQPTPTQAIVQNKADNDLNKAIAQTASTASPQPTGEPVPQPTKDHISGSFTNASNTVTVNIDADVTPPAMSKIPVAQVEATTIPADQIQKIVEAFYGVTKLYGVVSTKADIEDRILRMQKLLTDDNALLKSDVALGSGSTDLDELRKLEQKRIDQQKKRLANAPDQRPEIKGFNVAMTQNGLIACADLGEGQLGYVEASVDKNVGQMIQLYAFGGEWSQQNRILDYNYSTPIGLNFSDSRFQKAKQKANQMITDMGIQGVILGKIYLSKDWAGLSREGGSSFLCSDREFYVFCFERVIGEGSVGYNFISNVRNESKSEDDDYDRVLPYETIQIWMEGDQFRQFTWKVPMRLVKIKNDNVALAIDAKKAVELMKQQAFVQFVDANHYYSNAEVDISNIDLELVRIKERNTGNYLIIPAWVFHGQINAAVTQELLNVDTTLDMKVGQSALATGYFAHTTADMIMTINALDGSVIDQSLGY